MRSTRRYFGPGLPRILSMRQCAPRVTRRSPRCKSLRFVRLGVAQGAVFGRGGGCKRAHRGSPELESARFREDFKIESGCLFVDQRASASAWRGSLRSVVRFLCFVCVYSLLHMYSRTPNVRALSGLSAYESLLAET
eukprot:2686700-Rhodomonas_salina.1